MTGPELGAFDFLALNDAVLELSRRDLSKTVEFWLKGAPIRGVKFWPISVNLFFNTPLYPMGNLQKVGVGNFAILWNHKIIYHMYGLLVL